MKSLSHVWLCDPVDYSLPGSSDHGIFQARVLEWVAMSFSSRSSWPRDQTRVSRIVVKRFAVWAAREAILSLDSYNAKKRRRQWHPTPVLVPGKSHGLRTLVGYRPWVRIEWDTSEWLYFRFQLAMNPLFLASTSKSGCSCQRGRYYNEICISFL